MLLFLTQQQMRALAKARIIIKELLDELNRGGYLGGKTSLSVSGPVFTV